MTVLQTEVAKQGNGFVSMAVNARAGSKSSNPRSMRSSSSRYYKPRKFVQDTTPRTTMDMPNSPRPCFSYPSSLPPTEPYQSLDMPFWTTEKEQASYEHVGYLPGQIYPPDSDLSLPTYHTRPTFKDPWDDTIPLDNLILNQSEPVVNDDLYQLSQSSGSSIDGSHAMFNPLEIDPSNALSTAVYPGSDALARNMTENSFQSTFAPGSLSYDSSSSTYMSPPVSPDIAGQHISESPGEYGISGDYDIHMVSDVFQNGFSQRLSSPPSPPLSEGDPQAAFMSGQQTLFNSAKFVESSIRESGAYNDNPLDSFCRVSESALSGASTLFTRSTGAGSMQNSRPAPRILKPASERPKDLGQTSQSMASSAQTRSKDKSETAQPRNHPYYKALPGKDGMYRCPFAKDTQCAHPPTKQKCGYDKYLDSHLRPYQCKHRDCGELKFSSNACLFRHEREAHGMHFYGKNPHRCHFAGCERAIEGFPRRWNLHDHMRRVHKYNASEPTDTKEDYSDCEVVSNKRKGSSALSSCKMKRTSSSQAKARAASASYSRDQYETLNLLYQARPTQDRRKSHAQAFNLETQQTIDFGNSVVFEPQHLKGSDEIHGMSYGFSHL